jgi:hypothetical protein
VRVASVVAVLGLTLVLAGCGMAPSPTDEAPAARKTQAPLRLTRVQARRMARAMLIQPSDLPDWTETTLADADVPDSCFGVGGPAVRAVGRAESAFENEDDAAMAASFAFVFPSEPKARRWFGGAARMDSKRGRKCLSDSFTSGVSRVGVRSDAPRIGKIRYRVGAGSWGVRMSSRMHKGAWSARIHLSVVAIQQGQAVALIFVGQAFRPFARASEVRLARAVAKRMKLAQNALRQ